MVRDGVVSAQTDPAKKAQASRSWILLDSSGEGTILDVDKYAIMHRVQIPARDLRIIDPLLSYPSTILVREKAIVINLEHIKAIITADEVMLRDPLDDNVIPVVEELRRRLLVKNPVELAQAEGKENLGRNHDVESAEEVDLATGRTIGTVKAKGGLYHFLQMSVETAHQSFHSCHQFEDSSTIMLHHRRLGHPSFSLLKTIFHALFLK